MSDNILGGILILLGLIPLVIAAVSLFGWASVVGFVLGIASVTSIVVGVHLIRTW